jgi:hypothetical protein
MNLTRIDVRYSGTIGKAVVALGLVKRSNTVRYAGEEEGWLSLWGPVDSNAANGSLGIGIVYPRSSFIQSLEDTNHYMVTVSTSADDRITYYAGAGWTRSGDFGSVEEWNAYLSLAARALKYPLRATCYPAGGRKE